MISGRLGSTEPVLEQIFKICSIKSTFSSLQNSKLAKLEVYFCSKAWSFEQISMILFQESALKQKYYIESLIEILRRHTCPNVNNKHHNNYKDKNLCLFFCLMISGLVEILDFCKLDIIFKEHHSRHFSVLNDKRGSSKLATKKRMTDLKYSIDKISIQE